MISPRETAKLAVHMNFLCLYIASTCKPDTGHPWLKSIRIFIDDPKSNEKQSIKVKKKVDYNKFMFLKSCCPHYVALPTLVSRSQTTIPQSLNATVYSLQLHL